MEEEAAAAATTKEENQQILKVLEALKQASHDLQSNPTPKSTESNSIKALLELETESDSILSNDPYLSTLSHHLTYLKSIVDSLEKSKATRRHGLRSFLSRRVTTHEISRVAGSIESEIQAWIDRECIENLARSLNNPNSNIDEETLIQMLVQFEKRLNQGFNHELQDLVLKSKLFSELECVLCNSDYSKQPCFPSLRKSQPPVTFIAGHRRLDFSLASSQIWIQSLISTFIQPSQQVFSDLNSDDVPGDGDSVPGDFDSNGEGKQVTGF